MLVKKIISDQKNQKCIFAVPGFNQNPLALEPILNFYFDLGYDVFLFGYPEKMKANPVDLFHQEALSYVKDLSIQYKSVSAMGYSFGGVWVKVLATQFAFEKLLFFAPAFFLRPHCFLIKPLVPFVKKIPSLPLGKEDWEKKYRSHQAGVPSAEYKFLFDSMARFKDLIKDELSIKNIIFINSKDELINFNKLKKWHETNNPNGFFYEISKEGSELSYSHLIFDETTLSFEEFYKLKSQLQIFLN